MEYEEARIVLAVTAAMGAGAVWHQSQATPADAGHSMCRPSSAIIAKVHDPGLHLQRLLAEPQACPAMRRS
jgi:hypothetical protein